MIFCKVGLSTEFCLDANKLHNVQIFIFYLHIRYKPVLQNPCTSSSPLCVWIPYLPGALITWKAYSLFLPTAYLVPGDNIQNFKINKINAPVLWSTNRNNTYHPTVAYISFGFHLSTQLPFRADLVMGKWWQDVKMFTLLCLREESITLDVVKWGL